MTYPSVTDDGFALGSSSALLLAVLVFTASFSALKLLGSGDKRPLVAVDAAPSWSQEASRLSEERAASIESRLAIVEEKLVRDEEQHHSDMDGVRSSVTGINGRIGKLVRAMVELDERHRHNYEAFEIAVQEDDQLARAQIQQLDDRLTRTSEDLSALNAGIVSTKRSVASFDGMLGDALRILVQKADMAATEREFASLKSAIQAVNHANRGVEVVWCRRVDVAGSGDTRDAPQCVEGESGEVVPKGKCPADETNVEG